MIDLRDSSLSDGPEPADQAAAVGVVRARIGVASAAVGVLGDDARGWPDEVVAECVVDIAGIVADAERALLVAVGELDRRCLQVADGTKSTVSWLKAWAGMSGVAASARVRAARHLIAFPGCAQALSAGEITPAQVDVLARAAGSGRADRYRADEAMLLGMAREGGGVARFERAVSLWTIAADEQCQSDDPGFSVSQRHVVLAMRACGMLDVRGVIDEHGAPIVVEALEDLARPDPADRPGGPRTRPQRLADALVELARRHLHNPGGHPDGGRPYATVDVVLSAELVGRWLTEHAHDLPPDIARLLHGTTPPDQHPHNHRPHTPGTPGEGGGGGEPDNPDDGHDGQDGGTTPSDRSARGERTGNDGTGHTGRRRGRRRNRGRSQADRGGGLHLPGLGPDPADADPNDADAADACEGEVPLARVVPLGSVAAQIFRTGCVHPWVAQQFACDAWWGATLFNAGGEVLYHGRKLRLFSRAQRRAIFLRDQGCVFPGCDRGPEWCDVHHLDFWEHGGPTDLDNGCLLCRSCHTQVHHGWKLTPTLTGWTATPPPPRGQPGPDPPHPPEDRGPSTRGHPTTPDTTPTASRPTVDATTPAAGRATVDAATRARAPT